MVFAVSDREADYLRTAAASSIRTIPNGVDCQALADLPMGRPTQSAILFLGTMSWGPNADAARFLARNVLPVIRRQRPDVRLMIIGRDPPSDIAALGGSSGIEVTGSVPSVKSFLANAAALVVPLDAGGGTRLKILEAFAAGLPVVSTTVGIEGIAADAGVHFLQAERPSFAQVILDLVNVPARGTQLAERARVLAQAKYDWRQIGAKAVDAIAAVVDQTR